jgi:hypothetical protein
MKASIWKTHIWPVGHAVSGLTGVPVDVGVTKEQTPELWPPSPGVGEHVFGRPKSNSQLNKSQQVP